MTKNVYTIVSYNNYEIKILAFIINEGKSYLIYDELVDKVDVTKFTSDFDKDALSAKINEAVEESLKFTKQEKKDVYLVFDAHEFFFETKSLSFDFKDEHEINNTDVKKIYTNAMSNVGPKDGFTPVNFLLKNIIVNDDREVKSPVGMTVNKMTTIGEMVFADYTTTSAIKSVVSRYDINIVDFMKNFTSNHIKTGGRMTYFNNGGNNDIYGIGATFTSHVVTPTTNGYFNDNNYYVPTVQY